MRHYRTRGTHTANRYRTDAQANNETYEEACTHLKQQYDGYHLVKIARIFIIHSVCSMLRTKSTFLTFGFRYRYSHFF